MSTDISGKPSKIIGKSLNLRQEAVVGDALIYVPTRLAQNMHMGAGNSQTLVLSDPM